MNNTEKNIFLSGFSLGLIVCLIFGILLLCFSGCTDSAIAPRYTGLTADSTVVEINPNTMSVWATPRGSRASKRIKIDRISHDSLTPNFITAFKGQKPVATVFGNMAYYKP